MKIFNMEKIYEFAGRNCKEISKFESEGGNVEILEHLAQQIYDDPSRDVIITEFENFLRKSKLQLRAQLFMEYTNSGGKLETLKTCLEEKQLNGNFIIPRPEHGGF